MKANVIGAGLAGCEAAWQLAERGVNVTLYEMKPNKRTPAHSSDDFAELCCSNSLRADSLTNGVGLLKEEMRRLNSLIISCADETKVPAGGALAVDRTGFSALITEKIKNHPNITVKCEEVTELDFEVPTIVASGPLTSDALCKSIGEFVGKDYMYFYDAAAPIVTLDSIDMTRAYRAARYGKGGDDYINCPMTEEEYNIFYDNLINAEVAELHSFEDEKVFEGCMPIETMAKRGKQTMLFGPLKPVGLPDPKTGREPFAVVQLRQDNKDGTLYNLVGFQTHLKFGEQKRVFSMIGGLNNANFVRYGVMHRNTYINSPGFLDDTYKCKNEDNLYFAGQMTGVEGYVESASSGLVAGLNLARRLCGKEPVHFTNRTAIGALACYVSDESITKFQPMNVNFGIIESADIRIKNKAERYTYISNRALEFLSQLDVL